MNHFISIKDVPDPARLIDKSFEIKKNAHLFPEIGKNKVLGLIFFNASLRTRMSTTRAAYNLGMKTMTLNVTADSWKLEFDDGVCMDGEASEHIQEAIPVLCSYCDIIGVRSFPSLEDRDKDYREHVIKAFVDRGNSPIINLESATLHPLQSLADMMTIKELKTVERPKVVLTWAPHPKALPQAVSNSFLQWAAHSGYDLTITHPKGLDLADEFVGSAKVVYDQMRALEGADFVYAKNWSSYKDYGAIVDLPGWQITLEKLKHTNDAKLMHCLPVRRNVVIADDALDSTHSVVVQQAENRLYAAQAVLREILQDMS